MSDVNNYPLQDTAATKAGDPLQFSAAAWLAATALGQLLFVTFIIIFYFGSIVRGDPAAWNSKPLITGYVVGDGLGNASFAVHVLAAGIMTLAGLTQLVPAVRTLWPRFHRRSGRVFLTLALILSLGGLWLTWARGSYLTVTGAIAISIDAALIIAFGTRAWISAVRGNFAAHRRWALRTFIAASGVWFMRVGYMAWALTTGGAGVGPKMAGPFDLIWAFATYLFPLAILELYFVAERGDATVRKTVVVGLWFGAGLILLGSGGAWVAMWRPYL